MGDNGSKQVGRPTDYREEYARMAYISCRESGSTDKQLALLFDCAESTLNLWKLNYDEFSESIQKGKDEFNSNVAEKSLFKLVKGFRFTEVTREPGLLYEVNPETGKKKKLKGSKMVVTKKVTKFVPPNERSIRFFLKNRDPARWRDTQSVELSGRDGQPIEHKMTHFPSEPLTLAEWETQVKVLNEKTGEEEGLKQIPGGGNGDGNK